MSGKIAYKRPNQSFNARFTPAVKAQPIRGSQVYASAKDMTAHQKIHQMNDDSVNFNSQNFIT